MLKFAKFFILLSMVVIAPTCVFAADIPVVRAKVCDYLCQQYKSAHHTALKPATVPLACINFVQSKQDNVVLTFYRPNGSVLRELAKTAPAHGQFCFNRQMLFEAGALMLCDGVNTSVIRTEQVAILRQQGGMTPTQYACLLGKACKNYRGPRPQFAKAR